jgi:hypothetical protein
MERVGGDDIHPRTSAREVALASFIGTTVEWYDFFLYGTAALVFGPLFFPSGDPLTGTLIAFATLAVGFVARPIGGIVFGRPCIRSGAQQRQAATCAARSRRDAGDHGQRESQHGRGEGSQSHRQVMECPPRPCADGSMISKVLYPITRHLGRLLSRGCSSDFTPVARKIAVGSGTGEGSGKAAFRCLY